MKRSKRHVLVELSSSDSEDDFVSRSRPASKIKNKRLSIVIEKKKVSSLTNAVAKSLEAETPKLCIKKKLYSHKAELSKLDISDIATPPQSKCVGQADTENSGLASTQFLIANNPCSKTELSRLSAKIRNIPKLSSDKMHINVPSLPHNSINSKPKTISKPLLKSVLSNSLLNDDSLLLPETKFSAANQDLNLVVQSEIVKEISNKLSDILDNINSNEKNVRDSAGASKRLLPECSSLTFSDSLCQYPVAESTPAKPLFKQGSESRNTSDESLKSQLSPDILLPQPSSSKFDNVISETDMLILSPLHRISDSVSSTKIQPSDDNMLSNPSQKPDELKYFASTKNVDMPSCSKGDTLDPLSPDTKIPHQLNPETETSVCSATKLSIIKTRATEKMTTRHSSDSGLGYAFCQICKKNITSFSQEKRQSHINKCCDLMELVNNFGQDKATVPDKPSISTKRNCTVCLKPFAFPIGLKRHLPKCCEKHGRCHQTVSEAIFNISEIEQGIHLSLKEEEKKNKSDKKKKKEEKPIPALVLEKETAQNKAQNDLLDKISDNNVFPQSSEISSTPALKASKLTTYRSRRTSTSSIWNVAGNTKSALPSVLVHDNSVIQTQPKEDVPIHPSLPSPADITQLTQFLADLGNESSLKEQISCLSPEKRVSFSDDETSEIASVDSQVDTDIVQEKHYIPNDIVTSDTMNDLPNRYIDSALDSNVLDHSQFSNSQILPETLSTIEIRNTKKKRFKSTDVIKIGNTKPKIVHDEPRDQSNADDIEITQIINDRNSLVTDDSDKEVSFPKYDKQVSDSEVEIKQVAEDVDRSPNPSEISAVGESSVDYRSPPARPTSDLVSSNQDDSNIDLFGDEGKSPEEQMEFDRSLLNVSPITDHDPEEDVRQDNPVRHVTYLPENLPDEDVTDAGDVYSCDAVTQPASDVTLMSNQEAVSSSAILSKRSPVYSKKQCTSTTVDVDVNTDKLPTLISSYTQCDRAVRCTSSSAQCDTPATISTGTHVDRTTKSVQIQADYSMKNVEVDAVVSTASKHTSTDSAESVECATQYSTPETSLYKMMRQLLTEQKGCDMHIISRDLVSIPAHQYVLRSSCPMFFQVYHLEAAGTLKVDISGESTRYLLEYLYTRHIRHIALSEETLKQLHDVSLRLDLDELTVLLNTKTTETFEVSFRQSSGDTLRLKLSSRDLKNLSQQLDEMSSQQRVNNTQETSSVLKDDSFIMDSQPDFLNNDNFLNSTTRCEFEDDLPPSGIEISSSKSLFENSPIASDPSKATDPVTSNEGTKSPENNKVPSKRVNHVPEQLSQIYKELDSTFTQNNIKVEKKPHTSDLKVEADQLQQDVEFIDLVNSLDEPAEGSKSFSITESLLDTSHITLGSSKSPSTPGVSCIDLSNYQKTPKFADMGTPQINEKVNKFGLKQLSKKRAITKLQEIHRFTNKKYLKCPEEETKQDKTKSTGQKKKPSVDRSKRKRLDSESSGSEKECPVGNISVTEKVPKTKKKLVEKAARELILSDEELHLLILQYKPIEIVKFKERLTIKTSVALLAEILDEQGITYTNPRPANARGSKPKTKKKRA